MTIGEQIYRDQVDIDTSKLYDLVNEVGELPRPQHHPPKILLILQALD